MPCSFISPTLLVPEYRLETLVVQAFELQRHNCMYAARRRLSAVWHTSEYCVALAGHA